jgi:hypothetical protein
MKTKFHKYKFVFALLCLHLTSIAQKEPVAISAQAGIYTGYSNGGTIGPGVEVKAFKKISPTSFLSLGLGYINLRTTQKPVNDYEVRTRLVPVLIGYKKYWNKFYLEPRAGLGELGGKFSIGGDVSKPSVLAFMYALGTGYSFRKIEIGLELHGGAIGISSPDAGNWYNKRQFYSALKIGIPVIK